MKKVLDFLLHPIFLAVVGLLALASVVWWIGPLVAIGKSRPLASAGARLAVIGILVLLFALKLAFSAWRRRRANAKLVDGIAAGPSGAQRELKALDERFAQAIQTLRSAPAYKRKWFQGGRLLYELPWYVFIGAPGSGKTTALLNAGLRFPLGDKLGPGAVKGVGGTRNCDWWFTDEAVLIDTAGRYTTQDSDRETDAAAWGGFLKLLKKARPRQPLNGVLLTVSVQDLLQQTPDERREHATRLRLRVRELQEGLGLRVPVYVLVTKADLIAGFTEFFGELPREERDQAWGFSFAFHPDATDDPLANFGSEFAALEKRLRDRLLDRMQAEGDPARRAAIFAFPQQFAGLRGLLGGFLEQAFSGSEQLAERPLLRGVYFTSGTQEGTPIDRVMGALARTFGIERRMAPVAAGKGKSFFLSRLLREVVFSEAGLAGANRGAEHRRRLLRVAGLAAIGLAVPALVIAWAVSYRNNSAYVAQVAARAGELAKSVAALPPLTSPDIGPLNSVLSQVHGAARTDAVDPARPPAAYGMGLYQGDKLAAAADGAYLQLMRANLLPRVASRIEQQLHSVSTDNLEVAYQALKAYLMLYEPEHFDADQLAAWVELDWDQNLARTLAREQRDALAANLETLLAAGPPAPAAPMDRTLVDAVRAKLAAYPIEYRVYGRLKRARNAGLPDFTIAAAAGPQASQVFERASGEPITRGIAGIYTRDGYNRVFKGSIEKTALALAKDEEWVLGTHPDSGHKLQDLVLNPDFSDRVRRLYLQDYIKQYDQYLADIRMVRLGSLDKSLDVARTLSAVDSPLAALLRAVTRETTLVAANPDASIAGQIAAKANASRNELATLVGAAPADANAANAAPIEQMVDDHFDPIHRLVQGQPAPIDDVLKLFNDLYMQLSAVDLAQKSRSAPPPPTGVVERVRAEAGHQPQPVRAMLEALTGVGASQSQAAERQSLTESLTPVVEFCTRAVTDRYPFAPTAAADIPLEDFSRLFGPGGMFDSFFQSKLVSLVDTTSSPWTYRPAAGASRPIAAASLADFQRAAHIRDVLFANGGKSPAFKVEIRLLDLDKAIKGVTLEYDGQASKFTAKDSGPYTLQWPGAKGGAVRLEVATSGHPSAVVVDGPWALFRLFDRFEVQTLPQPERFNVTMNFDGRKALFSVTANSVLNPLRLPDLQQFHCPAAL